MTDDQRDAASFAPELSGLSSRAIRRRLIAIGVTFGGESRIFGAVGRSQFNFASKLPGHHGGFMARAATREEAEQSVYAMAATNLSTSGRTIFEHITYLLETYGFGNYRVTTVDPPEPFSAAISKDGMLYQGRADDAEDAVVGLVILLRQRGEIPERA